MTAYDKAKRTTVPDHSGPVRLSPRLRAVVDALPLEPGMRVIEIGCGPGAAARAVADRVAPSGHVLAVDRSSTAISQLTRVATGLIAAGLISTRCCRAEDLALEPDEAPYDLAFAIRVGAFDGRGPCGGTEARRRLAGMLVADGALYIDGGDPLRIVTL